MLAYVARRLLYLIPVIFGVTILTFVLFNVVGGDPVYQKMGKHGSEAEIKILRHELGLDRPLPEQYLFYLKQCVTFNFGRSWATNQNITDMLTAGIGPSMSLSIPAFFITIVLSILLSILIVFFRNGLMDKLLQVFCIAGTCISVLVYVILGQYFFAYKWGMFPISGYDSGWDSRWQFLALPMIIWVAVSIGYEVLLYRSAILEEVFQDYVRTARAKGLTEKVVLLKHVLKNSLTPIITSIMMEVPLLITGALVLEAFFGIPGLGGMIYQAVANSDFPVIKAMTFIGSVLFVLANLASDLLVSLVDPRVEFN
ncbi:MAG: ABC transporter permease [Oligoflexia bacterium]|nr:ABC transporter permease [Oligoflexia bacterium]